MVRRIVYPPGTRFADYADFQINYLNYRTGWLIPNTEIRIGDELKMRINSLACKGEELDPARGVIGFFGDSATFGTETDAWPFHLGIPGYQALLAAVEGHDFRRIHQRYRDLQNKVRLDAVVFAGSWHNLVYNEHGEAYWPGMFGSLCGRKHKTALCTLATAIDEDACQRGIDHLIASSTPEYPFGAWASWPTSAEKTREIWEALLRYNDCVRRYCKTYGTVLVDLFEAYRPTNHEELARGFYDPCHPRPKIYPTLAAAARKALEPRLRMVRATAPEKPPECTTADDASGVSVAAQDLSIEVNTVSVITPGDSIDFTSAGQSGLFKDGCWGVMDATGTRIEGHTAALIFRAQPPLQDDLIVLVRANEVFGLDDEPVRIRVFCQGEQLARWCLFARCNEVTACKVLLPVRLMVSNPICRLEFHVENQQSAQRKISDDSQELGIKIQEIAFTNTDLWRYSLGETLDFTEAGKGIDHADECWTPPDNLGSWTVGPEATLTLWPSETTDTRVAATFTINDAAVNEPNPALEVMVAVNGESVANWILGPTRDTRDRTILLPPDAFRTLAPVMISLRIESPRSSVAMQWSTWDKRPRGFRLSKLRLAPTLKYHVGQLMDFTEGGNATPFVRDLLEIQWSTPDKYGAWTIGNQATIQLPLDEPLAQTVPLSIVISDCMLKGRGARLPVIVKANGRLVGEWKLDRREIHTRSLTLPAEAVGSSPELTLTFEIPDPRSPASIGWGGDTRPLGFRLARAVIGRSEIEIPVYQKPPRPDMLTRILGLPGFALHVARLIWRR